MKILSPNSTDGNSQMHTVSSFLPKEDFLTSDALPDIHHSSCQTHSPIKFLLKLIYGKTKIHKNMKKVKYTYFLKNSMKKLLSFTYPPSVLNLLNYLQTKLLILMLMLKDHSSQQLTDIDHTYINLDFIKIS